MMQSRRKLTIQRIAVLYQEIYEKSVLQQAAEVFIISDFKSFDKLVNLSAMPAYIWIQAAQYHRYRISSFGDNLI